MIRKNVLLAASGALLLVACAAQPTEVVQTQPPQTGQATLDPTSPYRTTREEYAVRLKACLQERGLAVEVDPYDFSLDFSFGDARDAETAMAAVPECRGTIDPSRDDPLPPLTDEQLQVLYAYKVAQAACLTNAGYPASSAPPLQVFIDSAGKWAPDLIALQNENLPPAVLRQCEQVDGRPNFLDW